MILGEQPYTFSCVIEQRGAGRPDNINRGKHKYTAYRKSPNSHKTRRDVGSAEFFP